MELEKGDGIRYVLWTICIVCLIAGFLYVASH
jgi:hypothetical protein